MKHYFSVMRNVTITLEEDVVKWAKVHAAKNDTSISRMLGEDLKTKMNEEKNYHRAQEAFFSRRPKPLKKNNDRYASRDEIYER